MPVYNGERFLCRAIDSILAQTFTDFELIISNNASTDGTSEMCRGYAARDARVRYIAHAVNRGAAWNVNHVVTLARAPYFTWAHADDMRAPRQVECCVAELDRAPPSVVVVSSRFVFIDEHDRPAYSDHDRMDLRQRRPSDRLRLAVRHADWCHVVFGLIRTQVLRACRPLAGYLYSDLSLIHELAIRGQIWEISDVLLYRHRHPPLTPEDSAIMLEPRNRGILILPRCQVLIDTMRAIAAADLPWSEAFRCRVAVLRGWPRRYWRDMRDELKCAVRTWPRRFRDTNETATSSRNPEQGHSRLSAPGVLCRPEPAGGSARNDHADTVRVAP